MNKEQITAKRAEAILKRIEGLAVQDVSYDSFNVMISLGERFSISGIDVDEDTGEIVKIEKTAYKYCIEINRSIPVFQQDYSGKTQDGFRSEDIIHQVIDRVVLTEDNVLMLCFTNKKIVIYPGVPTIDSWRMFQPETEQDWVVLKDNLYRCFLSHKRWSENHASHPDQWHPFPLTNCQCWEKTNDVLPLIQKSLLGADILYMFKSKDMNIYNIGFTPLEHKDEDSVCELHIACGFSVKVSGQRIQYWGDSNKEEFEKQAADFINQKVRKLSLKDNNSLCMELDTIQIDIVPADDDLESWRLILPSGDHIAAANSWIGI